MERDVDTLRIENLKVPQGATFRRAWPMSGTDITTGTFLAQVRSTADAETILATLSVTADTLTVDGEEVAVALLEIADDVSASWTFRYGVFDVRYTDAEGVSTRLLGGRFEVSPAVSHA